MVSDEQVDAQGSPGLDGDHELERKGPARRSGGEAVSLASEGSGSDGSVRRPDVSRMGREERRTYFAAKRKEAEWAALAKFGLTEADFPVTRSIPKPINKTFDRPAAPRHPEPSTRHDLATSRTSRHEEGQPPATCGTESTSPEALDHDGWGLPDLPSTKQPTGQQSGSTKRLETVPTHAPQGTHTADGWGMDLPVSTFEPIWNAGTMAPPGIPVNSKSLTDPLQPVDSWSVDASVTSGRMTWTAAESSVKTAVPAVKKDPANSLQSVDAPTSKPQLAINPITKAEVNPLQSVDSWDSALSIVTPAKPRAVATNIKPAVPVASSTAETNLKPVDSWNADFPNTISNVNSNAKRPSPLVTQPTANLLQPVDGWNVDASISNSPSTQTTLPVKNLAKAPPQPVDDWNVAFLSKSAGAPLQSADSWSVDIQSSDLVSTPNVIPTVKPLVPAPKKPVDLLQQVDGWSIDVPITAANTVPIADSITKQPIPEVKKPAEAPLQPVDSWSVELPVSSSQPAANVISKSDQLASLSKKTVIDPHQLASSCSVDMLNSMPNTGLNPKQPIPPVSKSAEAPFMLAHSWSIEPAITASSSFTNAKLADSRNHQVGEAVDLAPATISASVSNPSKKTKTPTTGLAVSGWDVSPANLATAQVAAPIEAPFIPLATLRLVPVAESTQQAEPLKVRPSIKQPSLVAFTPTNANITDAQIRLTGSGWELPPQTANNSQAVKPPSFISASKSKSQKGSKAEAKMAASPAIQKQQTPASEDANVRAALDVSSWEAPANPLLAARIIPAVAASDSDKPKKRSHNKKKTKNKEGEAVEQSLAGMTLEDTGKESGLLSTPQKIRSSTPAVDPLEPVDGWQIDKTPHGSESIRKPIYSYQAPGVPKAQEPQPKAGKAPTGKAHPAQTVTCPHCNCSFDLPTE